MELVDFLRARLDEDERVAREAAQHAGAALATAAAHEGVWKPPYDGPEWWNDYDHIFVVCDRPGQPRKVMIADCGSGAFTLTPHIARQNPARVLAEVEAKRMLLADILTEPHATLRPGGSTAIYCAADSGLGEPCECGRDVRVSKYVRLLARPFRDHPDFDPSWLQG